MRGKAGDLLDVFLRAYAIKDDTKRIIGLVGVHTNITERKRAEEALWQKAEELRARNEELDLFNRGMVGRELRMIELKEEINELCRRLGEPPRHASQESDQPQAQSGSEG